MTQNNQQLWSRLTTAALLLTTLGTAFPGGASANGTADHDSDTNVAIAESAPAHNATDEIAPTLVSVSPEEAEPTATAAEEVLKVGEYQSENSASATEEAIANILPHTMDNRPAATLYVRDIPVITFLASPEDSASASISAPSGDISSDVKVSAAPSNESALAAAPASTASNDPVWRASELAARLNQLHLNGVDPETVTVIWDDEGDRFVIQVGEEDLVEINSTTILPDTTNDPAQDALQATNRIRRLLGGAAPLDEIEGLEAGSAQAAILSSIVSTLTGMASWYGPGFDGNYSASGEIFNQYALTAAHPSLPFGTHVRVTNMDNGQSVVVRINDRGPYAHGRIIDLSAGAAQVIGLVSSGVAPVRVDVLGNLGN